MLNPDEYQKLLDKARNIDGEASAIPIDVEGNPLPRITPDAYLYVACGEDCLVYIDAEYVVHDA